MIDKLFITLIAVISSVIAIIKFKSKGIREDFFLNFPMSYKMDRVAGETQQDLYSVPANYQAILAPRFSNIDYGAQIRYNMPNIKNRAVPKDPLGYGSLVEENYVKENYGSGGCRSCGGGCKNPSDCGKGGTTGNMAMAMQSQYGMNASPSYAQKKNSLQYSEATSMLPVGDMTSKALGSGQQGQGPRKNPIVYDRYMYANQRSRLYALGDPIRGDLPIVPCKSEWFRPSVHPHIDLRDGAIPILAGVRNQTSNRLHALQSVSTGGLYDTLGGVNYSTQKNSALRTGQMDLQVTSFP